MSPQNVKIVIAVGLVIVSLVGVPWAESGTSQSALIDLNAPPASKSCGDFQIPGPVGYPPIKVEVVQGNVPCRVARRVMKAQYVKGTLHGKDIGVWSCGGREVGITVCEKNQGGQGAIRARLYCRDWGGLQQQSSCRDVFGRP